MFGKGVTRVIENILYTDRGRIILSIILGLGLASLFRKFCDGKNCYYFVGPEQKSIKDQIYSFDAKNNTCYTLREKGIKCGNKKKTIEYS